MTQPTAARPLPPAPGSSPRACASSTCRSARCSGRGARSSWRWWSAAPVLHRPAAAGAGRPRRAGLQRHEHRPDDDPDDRAVDLRADDLDLLPALHRADPRRVLRLGADGRRDRGQDHHLPVHAADPARRGAVREVPGLPRLHGLRWCCLRSCSSTCWSSRCRAAWARRSSTSSRTSPAGARAGGLWRAVRLRRRPVQAAAADRADLHLRLGTGGAGLSGLPQAVHGRLLPAGAGAARHAERQRRSAWSRGFSGRARRSPGSLAGLAMVFVVFVAWSTWTVERREYVLEQ